jgi:endonuclease/exonuclease/phosphatase family metal-dependent hydrolase
VRPDEEPRRDESRRIVVVAAAAVVAVLAVAGICAWAFGVLPTATADRPTQQTSASPSSTTSPSDGSPTLGGTVLAPRHPHVRAPLQVAPITGPERCALRPPRIVHVLQFNIHAGVSRYGTDGLATIAAEINAWQPDIVSLNEVDVDAARSGRVDEASYLAQATGMHDVFGPNLVQADGHRFGNAILSRYPVRESANTRLPRVSGSEPRGMLHAVLRVEGRTVDFYSVHLTQGAVSGLPQRITQAEAITRVLRTDHRPTILAGDLNSGPGTLPVRILRGYLLDAQEQAGTGSGDTVPAVGPVKRIDYVLYDNHFRPTPDGTRVVASSSSDHRAVLSELILLPGGRC